MEVQNQENLETLIAEVDNSINFNMEDSRLCIGGLCRNLYVKSLQESPKTFVSIFESLEKWLGVGYDESLYIACGRFGKNFNPNLTSNVLNLRSITREDAVQFLISLRKPL